MRRPPVLPLSALLLFCASAHSDFTTERNVQSNAVAFDLLLALNRSIELTDFERGNVCYVTHNGKLSAIEGSI